MKHAFGGQLAQRDAPLLSGERERESENSVFFQFDVEIFLKDIQNKILVEVLRLKSKAQLTETVLNSFIEIAASIFENLFDEILKKFSFFSSKYKIDQKEIDFFLNECNKIKYPFEFINTTYKQENIIKSYVCFVVPVAIYLCQ